MLYFRIVFCVAVLELFWAHNFVFLETISFWYEARKRKVFASRADTIWRTVLKTDINVSNFFEYTSKLWQGIKKTWQDICSTEVQRLSHNYRVIHLKCPKRQAFCRVKDSFNPPTKFAMWLGRHREIHGYFFSSISSVLDEIHNIKDEKWFWQYLNAFS